MGLERRPAPVLRVSTPAHNERFSIMAKHAAIRSNERLVNRAFDKLEALELERDFIAPFKHPLASVRIANAIRLQHALIHELHLALPSDAFELEAF